MAVSATTRRTKHSAYPKPVDELIPAARALISQDGALPSRNQVMKHLRVGGPKAAAVLAALDEPMTRNDSGLHLVAPTLTTPTARVTVKDETTATEPASVGDGSAELAAAPTSVPDVEPEQGEIAPSAASPAASVEPVTSTLNNPRSDPGTDRPKRAWWRFWSRRADETAHSAEDTEAAGELVEVEPGRAWPVLLLAAPAAVAIWSGWVGLGGLTGFGVVHPLPGIVDSFAINTAITLPIGVEAYAAYALRVWLSGSTPARARTFARLSGIASLVLGAAGQIAYHLLVAGGVKAASTPWGITVAVACLPVAVLGMGAALTHLLHDSTPARRTRKDARS